MAVNVDKLEIVVYPHPALRTAAEPITQVNDHVRAVALRMLELMRTDAGIGLAGPQVGLPWRLFVSNVSGDPCDDMVFINPVISNPSRQLEEFEEGCLSLPEIRAQIRRPKQVTIDALDLDGRPFALTDDGLPARVWQHETDHLDQVLIIDKMAPIDRLVHRRALRDMEKAVAGK